MEKRALNTTSILTLLCIVLPLAIIKKKKKESAGPFFLQVNIWLDTAELKMNEPIHLNSLNFKGREFSSLLKLERVYLIYTSKAKFKKNKRKKKKGKKPPWFPWCWYHEWFL